MIIRPPKTRKHLDTFIITPTGKRGTCALCGHYADLTENHIPPEATGNADRWLARSYMTTMSAESKNFSARPFNGGVRFRTLCKACNNGLGSKEDKAVLGFYDAVRRLTGSSLFLSGRLSVSAKPNLIYKGLLAHLVSANCTGVPSGFDDEAKRLVFGKLPLRETTWSLFYWRFEGPELFIMRNAYHCIWHPVVRVKALQIIKLRPIAFMFAQMPYFCGLPNMLHYVQSHDEIECDVPIDLHRVDTTSVWPAISTPRNIMLLGGDSFGLVGRNN